jgi:hypothetical protein
MATVTWINWELAVFGNANYRSLTAAGRWA